MRHISPCLMRRARYLTTCALAACVSVLPAFAEQPGTEHVPAKLTCGSHSSNPAQKKAFQVELQFDVIGSLWLLDWKNTDPTSEVKFRGILSPSGTMLIAGLGKAEDGATWTYEFSGTKNASGISILKGSLQSEQPKGTRLCSLTFQKASGPSS
jgi:hypothetical protein